MKLLTDCSLYTFVDTAYLHGREPAELARALCAGGSDLIQLRAKASTPDEVLRMAESILPITRAAGVGLVVNDYPEIARAVGAEFCHLGQEDFFDGRVSAPGIGATPLGLSSHGPAQAERAIAAGAAYIAIGPVYATGTKPATKPVTVEYVRWAAANVNIPWFAIGGINLQNLDEVLEAGAKRICVVSAILKPPNVAKACQQFKKRLLSAR